MMSAVSIPLSGIKRPGETPGVNIIVKTSVRPACGLQIPGCSRMITGLFEFSSIVFAH